MFFSQRAAILKTLENQNNHKQLQNTETIKSKEIQNKNTPGCFCSKEKNVTRINRRKIYLRRPTRTWQSNIIGYYLQPTKNNHSRLSQKWQTKRRKERKIYIYHRRQCGKIL